VDILAHALWAGAAGKALDAKVPVSTATLAGIVALGVAPDVVPMLPVLAYAVDHPAAVSLVVDYAMAVPGGEPALPPSVASLTHHLHCAMHSVVVIALVTALAWAWRRRPPWVLLGWWIHVLFDIATHSDDFYAVPLFYPLSDLALDGIAWNRPRVLAANYATLALVYAWLWRVRRP
jgi:hypothetical protein